jgi:Ser/Thr protein kinase RdoA (MazF antagonist)
LSAGLLGPVEACQLFTPGVTHTYLVKTENEKYMLRVYRHAWRTPSDVQY